MFWSYQKVKETVIEVFGRSGGVARFSIAAFRDSRESKLAVDRGKRSHHRMEAREFKRTLKVLIVPPGAPTLPSPAEKDATNYQREKRLQKFGYRFS